MLASGLSAIALNSRLPLQDHVVPVDQLGAAKIAENVSNFTALAADDGFRLLVVVSGEPAAKLGALAVSDHHRIAALEAPLAARDAGRKQTLPRGERRRSSRIYDEGALWLECACNPAFARRHRVRARQKPGTGSFLGERLQRVQHLAAGDDHISAAMDRD